MSSGRVIAPWRPQGIYGLPHPLRASLEELERRIFSISSVLRELGNTKNTLVVSAPSHGATDLLELWGHNGSAWTRAQATLAGNLALGLTVAIPDSNHLELAAAGWQTLEAHGMAVGKHWTSTSVAGATQTSAPGPGFRVQLAMQVVDPDNFVMFPTEAVP